MTYDGDAKRDSNIVVDQLQHPTQRYCLFVLDEAEDSATACNSCVTLAIKCAEKMSRNAAAESSHLVTPPEAKESPSSLNNCSRAPWNRSIQHEKLCTSIVEENGNAPLNLDRK
jgi:hypothetical protein